MTDYLGQLVLRGRQPILALEPRQASRFERPSEPALALAPELPAGPGPARAEPGGAVRDVASAPAEHRRRPPLAVDLTVGATTPDHGGESPAVAHSVSQSARTPVRQRPAVFRDSDTTRPFDPVTQPASAMPEPAGASRRPASAATLRERVLSPPPEAAATPAPRPHDHIEGEGSSLRDAAPDHERPGRPQTRVRGTTEVVARVDRARPPDLQPASTVNERPTTPATGDAGRPAADAAPTIHVTIGRVEIRAAAAAPVARKPSPRPPTLTLEQYLRQRRGASHE